SGSPHSCPGGPDTLLAAAQRDRGSRDAQHDTARAPHSAPGATPRAAHGDGVFARRGSTSPTTSRQAPSAARTATKGGRPRRSAPRPRRRSRPRGQSPLSPASPGLPAPERPPPAAGWAYQLAGHVSPDTTQPGLYPSPALVHGWQPASLADPP